MQSRLRSTRVVGEAIASARRPPRVWLQASTATIYAHRYDAAHDEATGILGGTEPDAPDTWRFSIDVAKAWEAAAGELDLPGTRTVLLRSAMTMSPDLGGVFDVLLGLVRRGLGGGARCSGHAPLPRRGASYYTIRLNNPSVPYALRRRMSRHP